MASPKPPAERTLVDELSTAFACLTRFHDAALDAQRRQQKRVAGDVWSSVDDMRVAADRADTALFAAHLLLPHAETAKTLTAVAASLKAWSLALEVLGDPGAPLRSPFDKRAVAQALGESCLWILVVRHALHGAELAHAGAAEVSS